MTRSDLLAFMRAHKRVDVVPDDIVLGIDGEVISASF